MHNLKTIEGKVRAILEKDEEAKGSSVRRGRERGISLFSLLLHL